MKIAEIREITTAPIIALTATATPLVVKDIQEKLKFDNENVISTSFYRDELSYVVLKQDDKDSKLIQILNRVKGTSIIYCRTRKETKRIHLLLSEYGITSLLSWRFRYFRKIFKAKTMAAQPHGVMVAPMPLVWVLIKRT